MASQTSDPLWKQWHDPEDEIRIGISTCLLGKKVRFDGGHKRDRYLTDVLGDWVTWVPSCPEIEIGLPIPRPSLRLVAGGGDQRLVMEKTGDDLTETMESYSHERIDELEEKDLDGYVLKRSSPSCGMERVRLYGKGGVPSKNGVGTFARVLMDRWPNLPVEEEGRLNDAVLRENFIQRVFCNHRWRGVLRRGSTRRDLVEFHTAHKMLFRSHNEAGYRRLGRVVASAGTIPDDELFRQYEDEMAATLRTKATAKRHANVMYHVMGYLKQALEPAEKREALTLIEDYRRGLLPLIAPLTLLRHHVARHDIEYMQKQLYLEPHPKELMLLNRV